jgi:hypothetical protein
MGTELHLTTRTESNTKDNHAADRFHLEVAEPVVYRGQTIIPAGSPAIGEIMRAERNGHFGKRGDIEVRLLYVETPSGPGRMSRQGTGQGLLSIGGAIVLVGWVRC